MPAHPGVHRALAPSGGLPDWFGDTPCVGETADFFIEVSDRPTNVTRHGTDAAHDMCDGCPVQRECADWLMAFPSQQGYGGGMSPSQRDKRRRAVVRVDGTARSGHNTRNSTLVEYGAA